MNTALSGPNASGPGSAMAWALNVCALGGLLGSAACGKVSEAAPGTVTVVSTAGPAAAPEIDHANYTARMSAAGPCRKDQTCSVEITVTAKGDYHINEKYPYRFKLDEPPRGVRYPKPVTSKEDGAAEERKLTLKVPFIAEAAGDVKVAGTLSFSVCSAANCLMDKQPLEVTVKVE